MKTRGVATPVHLNGYPHVACGIESSSAVVSDDILKVTCHDCLIKHYDLESSRAKVN
jgi:hypothetical protein